MPGYDAGKNLFEKLAGVRIFPLLCNSKCFFMDHPNQANESLETLQDIRRMMERSSRFISLSGLSGVSAGVCALIGAYIAYGWIHNYTQGPVDPALLDFNPPAGRGPFPAETRDAFELKMLALAAGVLITALATATAFTWRKARRSQLPIWDH